jgi:hypothetical protein
MIMMMMMMMMIIIIIIIIKSNRYGPYGLAFESQQGQNIYLFSKTSRPAPDLPSSCSLYTRDSTHSVKRPEHVAYHSLFGLRMSGAVPVRSMYAFGVGVETAATTAEAAAAAAAAAQFSD